MTKRETGVEIVGVGDRSTIVFNGCVTSVPEASIANVTIHGRGDLKTTSTTCFPPERTQSSSVSLLLCSSSQKAFTAGSEVFRSPRP